MSQIHNSDTIKEVLDGAKIQTAIDNVPKELGKTVVPVMEVNPKFFRVCNIVRGTDAIVPTNVYVTPTDRDFFLVSAFVSCGSHLDALGERIITVTIDAQAQTLLKTAADGQDGVSPGIVTNSASINPRFPIKLDRGSNVISSGTGTVGSVGIVGYTVEV